MAKVEGVHKVIEALRKHAERKIADAEAEVIVGYTAAYAVHVHENLEMKWKGLPRSGETPPARFSGSGKGLFWDPQGRAQSKFLEDPCRRLAPELGRIVREILQRGKSMIQALLVAGLRLQRESMLLVPVDTGNLKASAFTRDAKSKTSAGG